MARKPRYNVVGLPQHVIQRGNNRQECFFNDEDRLFYCECLKEASKKYRCDIHTYVLMTNHVHLLTTPRIENGISFMMQSVGRRYVRYINNVYRRSGALWEGRYKASLVGSDNYVLACYRYIEQNPVRAGMVDHPVEYGWSGHRHNAGFNFDPLIVAHSAYENLAPETTLRQEYYQSIFNKDIPESDITCIRRSINKNQVFGDQHFILSLENRLNRRIREGQPGRPKKNIL